MSTGSTNTPAVAGDNGASSSSTNSLADQQMREKLQQMAASAGSPSTLQQDDDQEEDDDDEFSGDEEDGVRYTGVGLGFSENPIHPISMRRDYFPSKIGGRPGWLVPDTLPLNKDLICSHCERPYRFLLQVYAPISDIESAFHRTVFVFCCTSGACVVKNSSIKIFRSQLPRKNEFYSDMPPCPADEAAFDPALPMDLLPHPQSTLCEVCALPASKKCPSCSKMSYCTEEHQAFDWKMGHSALCSMSTDMTGDKVTKTKNKLFMARESALYPCLEIITEEEGLEVDEETKTHAKQLLQTYEDEREKLTPDQRIKDDQDVADLFGTQSPTAAPTANADESTDPATSPEAQLGTQERADPTFVAFQTCVSYNPDQIIRYIPRGKRIKAAQKFVETGSLSVSSNPLWISTADKLSPKDVPPCAHCQGPRDFEFQIMPQILYMIQQAEEERKSEVGAGSYEKWCLSQNKILNDDDLDFGTISVYTCRQSCQTSTPYVSEFVHLQPPFM